MTASVTNIRPVVIGETQSRLFELGCRLLSVALVSSLLWPRVGKAEAGAPWTVRTWQPAGVGDLDGAYVSEDANSVVLGLPGGGTTNLNRDRLGTEDLRYLSNVAEVSRPFRAWTFHICEKDEPGGPKDLSRVKGTLRFDASFVELTGFDTIRSESWVVVVRTNGAKRAYPLLGFSTEDQAYVRDVVNTMPEKTRSSRFEHVKFVPAYEEYDPERDRSNVNIHETAHFVFYWGNEQTDAGKLWFDPEFRKMNYAYFETLWTAFAEDRELPIIASDTYDKINVYVTETGLPKHKHGWAFGAQAIVVDPRAMQEGSSVTPHEFGHSMQMRLGGFRDNLMVGSFWETHADWQAHLFIPSMAGGAATFVDTQQYGARSVLPRYQNWPFLQYIYEHPRFDPFFNYEIWARNIKNDRGESEETPVETMIRLLGEHGYLPGDPTEAFGDVIGEMAAHVVTWDFVYQYAYQRADERRLERADPNTVRRRLMLQPVPDRAGWYSPPYLLAPRTYGFNIVDLELEPGVTNVGVELSGVADEYEYSDWRATIVAIDAAGEARYSRMWRQGARTMALRPGETRLALAVAAAPSRFRPRNWVWIDFNQYRRFPYEVAFKGCRPAATPSMGAYASEDGGRHANGGGFVAKTAMAEQTAYVGADARVLGHAKVGGKARIEDHAVVKDHAVISGSARVGDRATVTGNAKVDGNALIGDMAVLSGNGIVGGNAVVRGFVSVANAGKVDDNAVINGVGRVSLGAKGKVGGTAMVGDIVNFNPGDREVLFGQFHGDVLDDGYASAMEYGGLQAHWDFNEPRREVLRDAFAAADGVLRGRPLFVESGVLNAALAFNGKDQYAVLEGGVADARDMTLDMRLWWDGGPEGQQVLSFGSDTGEFFFTPRDKENRAAFVIRSGCTTNSIAASRALPTGRWVRVTVTLSGGEGTLFVDGDAAGRNSTMTLCPRDVGATAGYIGRGYGGGGFFAGRVDDVALYNTAVTAVADISDRWWLKRRRGTWTRDDARGVLAGEAAPGAEAEAVLPRHWRDYAFTVRVRRVQGNGPVSLLFRVDYGRYEWVLGADENTKTYVTHNGGRRLGPPSDFVVEDGRWYDVAVTVNSGRYACYVDGRLMQSVRDMTEPVGGIGLTVADGKAEFRDIRVVGADGRLLYPAVPGGEQVTDGRP